ncbi:MAG: acyl-CoA dehydrogenase [Deltaproteobacteria bacterium]|nr:MAG: acyl-CoA dehydrogenase [Deltaproteobacteria bacterium]
MNFELDPALAALRDEVRRFIDDVVIPEERTVEEEDREGRHDTLRRLQQQARSAGLWTPHLPAERGGRGFDGDAGYQAMAVAFREMGRSPVGPRVCNCDAPDQGNMDLLLRHGTPDQQARWLDPLCSGDITSAFAMTEPSPGAGADPGNLRTSATRDGDHWVLRGRKWYTTGGRDAAFLIVMARTSHDRRGGATLFLVDRQAEGLEHVREVSTMAEPILAHRESEFALHDVRVGPDAVLGEVGDGFAMAQERLVPARLTHCMRWLGLASRTLSLCRAYVVSRESFGKELARHQLVQQMLAEAASRIHAGDLMTHHCAWLLARGQRAEARTFSSMAKLEVARTLCTVLDHAIQIHGGLGYSDDMPFARWYRMARAARIADGPDEVHIAVIARDWLRGRLDV